MARRNRKSGSQHDSNYIPDALLPLLKHNLPNTDTSLVIGIDPGASVGYAEYDCKLRRWAVETYNPRSIWVALHTLNHRDTFFVVEYNKGHANAFGQRLSYSSNASAATGFDVGLMAGLGIGIAAQILAKWGPAHLKLVDPTDHKQRKWDADTAKQMTGFPGRTNEHNRDAMRMVLFATQSGYQDKAFYQRDCEKIQELQADWKENQINASVFKKI